MLLIVILAVLLTAWLIHAFSSKNTNIHPSDITLRQTPMGILQEQFARGEIDEEEYQQRRRNLADKHFYVQGK